MEKLKITVSSGKGGTGKTFFSVNLYYSLKENFKTCLIDLDVEEPNSGIFIKENNFIEEISYLTIPEVDKEKCILCGNCSEYCEFNAIFVTTDKWYLFPELCKGCTACIKLCPHNALKYGKKEHGIIKWTDSGFMEGRLKIKEPISVPLIEKTKEKAYKIFKDYEIFIFDSPPGVTCPTIASIKHADFIVLVAEPTPFGFNDFKLTYEMLKNFDIPYGVVINRFDIGNNELEYFCRENNIPILTKIPHDIKIAQCYSQGIPVVEIDSKYKDYFYTAFERIKEWKKY